MGRNQRQRVDDEGYEHTALPSQFLKSNFKNSLEVKSGTFYILYMP